MGQWNLTVIPIPHIISSGGSTALGPALVASNLLPAQAAAAVWTTANTAWYCPFNLPQIATITQFFTWNGTVGTDRVDLGIFSADGTSLITTGSTVLSGNTTIQLYNTTDITLNVGDYFLAMAMNGTTDTMFRVAMINSTAANTIGCRTGASSFPLSTTTAAAPTGITCGFAIVPMFGCITASTM